MRNLYAVAASIEVIGNGMQSTFLEVNCALANSEEEALEWFSGYVESKYPPRKGYRGYLYEACLIPEEVR